MSRFEKDEKDISKVFGFLRGQLQAKEKKLLQLQRKDPTLSAPDAEQIDAIVSGIASLQLSTQDDSFVFASGFDDDRDDDDDDDDSDYGLSPYVSLCSDDFNAIKARPCDIWLSEHRTVQQMDQRRESIANHILSLPIRTFLAFTWPVLFNPSKTPFNHVQNICTNGFNAIKAFPYSIWLPEQRTIQQTNQRRESIVNYILSLPIRTYLASFWPVLFNPSKTPLNHIHKECHLLFMPLHTFKPSTNTPTNANIYLVHRNKRIRSFLNAEIGFSKECWLKTTRDNSYNNNLMASA